MQQKHSQVSTWHILVCVMIGVAGTYLAKSIDCATGGSCTFTNGDLANWIVPKILLAEKVILGVISN